MKKFIMVLALALVVVGVAAPLVAHKQEAGTLSTMTTTDPGAGGGTST